jgi:glycosyltransferase involved in cell wall biosynthesis
MLDVIIPVFNDSDRVCRAVRSAVAAVGLSNVIVVDDGSVDTTRETILEIWPNICLKTIRNSGPSIARNVGIELSNANYVLFLDSDDELIVDNVRSTLSYLQRNMVDFVYFCKDDTPIDSTIWHVNTVAISDVVVRRELVVRTGMFDIELWQHEDWDLWARCIAERATTKRLGSPLSLVYNTPLSNSSNYLNMAITNIEVLRRNTSRFAKLNVERKIDQVYVSRFRHLVHDVTETTFGNLCSIRKSYFKFLLKSAQYYLKSTCDSNK